MKSCNLSQLTCASYLPSWYGLCRRYGDFMLIWLYPSHTCDQTQCDHVAIKNLSGSASITLGLHYDHTGITLVAMRSNWACTARIIQILVAMVFWNVQKIDAIKMLTLCPNYSHTVLTMVSTHSRCARHGRSMEERRRAQCDGCDGTSIEFWPMRGQYECS